MSIVLDLHLADALAIGNHLGAIGRDFSILLSDRIENNRLILSPQACDRLLQSQKYNPPHTLQPVEPSGDPVRRDREIDFPDWERVQSVWDNFPTLGMEGDRDRALAELRNEVVLPVARSDVLPGKTLVYGGSLDGAIALDAPDGKHYSVERLIHLSHPVSAEDLWLRECRVECKEICRYRVPGLDDRQWARQNAPRGAVEWRSLLLARAMAS